MTDFTEVVLLPPSLPLSPCLQMEVIVGDFGIVVVPRDAADTDRIMNHSSILRKYKVSLPSPAAMFLWYSLLRKFWGTGRVREQK